jgi:putative endonuclease
MGERTFCVYILASRSRDLYTGVTNNLERRMVEHREGLVAGFTSRYRISRLVHYEVFTDIRYAIVREKEVKGWRRKKKIWLIQRENPTWEDLSEKFEKFASLDDWRKKPGNSEEQRAEKYGAEKQIPHPHPRKARLGSG